MDRGFSSSFQQPSREGAISAEFSDIRTLQILTDKLKRLIHTLKLNRNLCDHLMAFSTRLKLLSSHEHANSFSQFDIMMDNYLYQNETHILQLETLVNRSQGVGSLVSPL